MVKTHPLRHLMVLLLATPITFFASSSQAGDVDINFHLGGYARPPVIITPQPRYRSPGPVFYFDATPDFIYMDSLGFDVAMGSPYDLFRYSNFFYIFHQGYWHKSSRINGPWHRVDYRSLPYGFRRHKIEHIRRYRDVDYHRYRHDNRDDRRNYHGHRDHRNDRNDWEDRHDRGHR